MTANRVFLQVQGNDIEGIMMGTATENALDFLYEIGIGAGEAHLKKLTTSAEDKIAAQE